MTGVAGYLSVRSLDAEAGLLVLLFHVGSGAAGPSRRGHGAADGRSWRLAVPDLVRPPPSGGVKEGAAGRRSRFQEAGEKNGRVAGEERVYCALVESRAAGAGGLLWVFIRLD